MSGGGGQTTVQNNQPPQQFLDAYTNVMNQAQNVAGTPFQTPQAPVAPLNGYQGTAAQNTFAAQGAAQPDLNQAAGLINQSQTPIAPSYQPFATGALDSAYAGAATPILNTYQPFGNQAAAGYAAGANTPLESNYQPFANQAVNGYFAGQSANILGQAAGLSDPAASMYAGTAGGISPQTVQQYESPYTQQVVQATQNEFNNQNEQQQQAVVGNAVSSGAWGGDRSAVAQGITAGQQQLAQAPVIAGLENQGYSQALQTAQQQQQMQQQAAAGLTGIAGLQTSALEQQAQNQIAGAQGIAGVGAEEGALGEQQAQNQFTAAAGNAAIGGQEMSAAEQQAANQFQYAGMQQTVGQTQVGAQEAQDWLASQGASAYAGLGAEQQNTELTGANALMGAGNVLQSQQQAEMNAPYEEQLAQEAYPFQTTQWLANIAEGTGSAAGGTSSTTAPGPSAVSQIGGLATTGLGIAALAGLLKDGGRVQPRAMGGGIGAGGAAMIPGMPAPSAGSGIHGVVDIVPDTSTMQPGAHGSGPPRPPATTPTSASQTSGANEATGMMNAIKLGQQGNAGLTKAIGTGEGLYSAATFAPDAAATEAASTAGAAGIASGAGEGLGLMAAAKRGGAIPTFGLGGMINAPRAPRLQHMPHMGIAGGHAFHPPGLAPGGGIAVDPYPNQTDAEVQNLNAAQDQSNAMAMAMASLGTSPAMMGMGMMARGGGIAGYADGGAVDDTGSFDDTPSDSGSPITISGAGDSNSMPTPPVPPEGGPPPEQSGGIAGQAVSTPAAQVTTSPDAGPEPKKGGGIMDNKEIWTSVLAAGLGMMGGTSPFAGVNIGRGGLEGLSMYNQLRNRDENVALRQQQQESNNLYRQGLLADKGQGRDIQRDRAATYSQMQQDHASLMQAQAALAMARAANTGASKMNDAELKQQVMKSLIGQPKDPNDPNSPKMTQADAYRSISGLDIRQEVADTGAKRADIYGQATQQRLAIAQDYNNWRMQHGDAQLDETQNFHGYLKQKGMTDQGIRIYEGSKNPITGEFGLTMDEAQKRAAQGRAANQPAGGGQPMSQTQSAPADPLGIR
jgi:hypothetical protein